MKNGTSSHSFFKEKNVSVAVAHNKINISYVISQDKITMWVS